MPRRLRWLLNLDYPVLAPGGKSSVADPCVLPDHKLDEQYRSYSDVNYKLLPTLL